MGISSDHSSCASCGESLPHGTGLACPDCGSPHHLDCLSDLGCCAMCLGARKPVPRTAAAVRARAPKRRARWVVLALALLAVAPLLSGLRDRGASPATRPPATEPPVAAPDVHPTTMTATLPIEPGPSDVPDLQVRRVAPGLAELEGTGGFRFWVPEWLVHRTESEALVPGDRIRPCWSMATVAGSLGPHLTVLFEFGPALGLEVVGRSDPAVGPIGCLRSVVRPVEVGGAWRLTLHRLAR
jgi:hypothetical protein